MFAYLLAQYDYHNTVIVNSFRVFFFKVWHMRQNWFWTRKRNFVSRSEGEDVVIEVEFHIAVLKLAGQTNCNLRGTDIDLELEQHSTARHTTCPHVFRLSRSFPRARAQPRSARQQ